MNKETLKEKTEHAAKEIKEKAHELKEDIKAGAEHIKEKIEEKTHEMKIKHAEIEAEKAEEKFIKEIEKDR